MPVLNADIANKVYLARCDEDYAGIVNALFYGDNCGMVHGATQVVLVKTIEAVRRLGLAAAA
jgi:NAD(P) transhydrogenase subunit beta